MRQMKTQSLLILYCWRFCRTLFIYQLTHTTLKA